MLLCWFLQFKRLEGVDIEYHIGVLDGEDAILLQSTNTQDEEGDDELLGGHGDGFGDLLGDFGEEDEGGEEAASEGVVLSQLEPLGLRPIMHAKHHPPLLQPIIQINKRRPNKLFRKLILVISIYY